MRVEGVSKVKMSSLYGKRVKTCLDCMCYQCCDIECKTEACSTLCSGKKKQPVLHCEK